MRVCAHAILNRWKGNREVIGGVINGLSLLEGEKMKTEMGDNILISTDRHDRGRNKGLKGKSRPAPGGGWVKF